MAGAAEEGSLENDAFAGAGIAWGVGWGGKDKDGLRPACLTQVRICEPGAPIEPGVTTTVFSTLVDAEVYFDVDFHRHGFALQHGGLELVLLHCFDRLLVHAHAQG